MIFDFMDTNQKEIFGIFGIKIFRIEFRNIYIIRIIDNFILKINILIKYILNIIQLKIQNR